MIWCRYAMICVVSFLVSLAWDVITQFCRIENPLLAHCRFRVANSPTKLPQSQQLWIHKISKPSTGCLFSGMAHLQTVHAWSRTKKLKLNCFSKKGGQVGNLFVSVSFNDLMHFKPFQVTKVWFSLNGEATHHCSWSDNVGCVLSYVQVDEEVVLRKLETRIVELRKMGKLPNQNLRREILRKTG